MLRILVNLGMLNNGKRVPGIDCTANIQLFMGAIAAVLFFAPPLQVA